MTKIAFQLQTNPAANIIIAILCVADAVLIISFYKQRQTHTHTKLAKRENSREECETQHLSVCCNAQTSVVSSHAYSMCRAAAGSYNYVWEIANWKPERESAKIIVMNVPESTDTHTYTQSGGKTENTTDKHLT